MKKNILIIVFCLFSFNSYAVSGNVYCNFVFNKYLNANLSSEVITIPIFIKQINFNVEFKTNSKLDWKILKISLPNDFKKNLDESLEYEIEVFKKILNNKKLNKYEEGQLSVFALSFGLSVEEFSNVIIKLSNKEKKEAISEYKKNLYEFMPDVDDFISDQYNNLNEIKNMLNSSNEISSDKDNVYISAVLDSGLMFKNTINYSKILDSNSKDAIKLQMVFTDGSSMEFGSKCSNNSNLFTDSSSNNDNNDIESKLKKLKSLFDQNLITKDEYDAKRKAILDEM